MLRKALLMTIIATVLSLVLACGATGTVTPIKVVPEKSNLIAWMDLTGMLEEEEEITSLYEGIQEDPEVEQVIEDVLEIVQGLEEGLLFMDLSETSEEDAYLGIIVKGTFVENDLILEIEEAADKDLEIAGYKNYQIYTDPLEEIGLSFLSADAFVFGSVEAIKDVIDVKEGSASAVSGKIIDTYNALGEGKVKLAATIPTDLAEQSLDESDLQLGDVDSLSDLETIGLTYDGSEEFFSFRAQLCFASSESANEAMKAVVGIITLVEMFSTGDDGDGLSALVDKLNMEVINTCLNIDFEVTVEEIEAVMESLAGSFDESDLEGFDSGFDFDFGNDTVLDDDFWDDFEIDPEFEDDFLDLLDDDFFNELEAELEEEA